MHQTKKHRLGGEPNARTARRRDGTFALDDDGEADNVSIDAKRIEDLDELDERLTLVGCFAVLVLEEIEGAQRANRNHTTRRTRSVDQIRHGGCEVEADTIQMLYNGYYSGYTISIFSPNE